MRRKACNGCLPARPLARGCRCRLLLARRRSGSWTLPADASASLHLTRTAITPSCPPACKRNAGNIGGPRESLRMLKIYSSTCMMLFVHVGSPEQCWPALPHLPALAVCAAPLVPWDQCS